MMIIDQVFEQFTKKYRISLLVFFIIGLTLIMGVLGSFWYSKQLDTIESTVATMETKK